MGDNINMPVTENTRKRLKSEMRVFYGASLKDVLSDFSVDLSTGGLFIETKTPLKVDGNLKLMFSFPGHEEKAISCDARVAWINQGGSPLKSEFPDGVGVQFLDLAPEDLASIASFLELEPVW